MSRTRSLAPDGAAADRYRAAVTTDIADTLELRSFPRLARTGAARSSATVVGLGCWQLGADWGDVTEDDALSVLQAAYDSGVRFFDTAMSTVTGGANS